MPSPSLPCCPRLRPPAATDAYAPAPTSDLPRGAPVLSAPLLASSVIAQSMYTAASRALGETVSEAPLQGTINPQALNTGTSSPRGRRAYTHRLALVGALRSHVVPAPPANLPRKHDRPVQHDCRYQPTRCQARTLARPGRGL